MPFTPAIKELTVRRANTIEIKRRAVAEGMRTLRQCGWRRASQGTTTVEEVLRVTADAESMLSVEEAAHAPVSI
jgi:type II secretory ATPase GspE/PulE/Tfp pilus assembly ATPase PilB-like protein